MTPSATATPTPTSTPIAEPEMLYLSFSSTKSYGVGSAGNVSDEDILVFDGIDFTKFLDGSDIGLGSNGVDAFSIVNTNQILLSLTKPHTLSGLGEISASDILIFNAISTGENTSGNWSIYFDGSDVELTAHGENIDAFSTLLDGRLLISTTGNFSVTGASGRDEDILVFTPSSLGNSTSGDWMTYFDSSDTGISDDIDGLDVGNNGEIYLSTVGNVRAPGVDMADEDILICFPINLGTNTACNFNSDLFFNGSLWGLSSYDLNGFSIH